MAVNWPRLVMLGEKESRLLAPAGADHAIMLMPVIPHRPVLKQQGAVGHGKHFEMFDKSAIQVLTIVALVASFGRFLD
jgi:hypothetical protein